MRLLLIRIYYYLKLQSFNCGKTKSVFTMEIKINRVT
ncbi:unnamed protein product [Tenebrio molitor]|nr:unnamed protein product [Tenebrio molitor]